MSILNISFNE